METEGIAGKRPAAFLRKAYDIVDDPNTDELISWTRSGTSFIVKDSKKFASDVLPLHFKHSNFESFHRQLNNHGFTKIRGIHLEFENSNFVRGQRRLLANIARKKLSCRPQARVEDAQRNIEEEWEWDIDELMDNPLLNSFATPQDIIHNYS